MHSVKKTVTALCLLVAMLASTLVLASCGKQESFFFLEENMADFISLLPSDYTGVALTVPGIAEITDADVEKTILSTLASYNANKGEPETQTDGVIKKGDVVTIWYRGEVNMAAEGEPEKWIDFIGGCNFYPMSSTTAASATDLLIGSGNMIAGFEDALVGLEISESKLSTVKDKHNFVGKEGLSDIVYIKYSYEYTDAKGNPKKGVMYDRVDLRKEGDAYLSDSRYSTALRDALFGRYVGEVLQTTEGGRLKVAEFSESFDITGDLEAEELTVWSVQVAEIVKEDTPLKNKEDATLPYTFSLAFPNPYSSNTALAGKTARWYVYADKITRYSEEEPSLSQVTYDFVVNTTTGLGITFDKVKPLLTEAEALAASASEKGKQDAVLAHYREYIKKALEESRKNQLQSNTVSALWEHIVDKVEIKEWPKGLLDNYVEALTLQAKQEFDEYVKSSGNALYSSMEEYVANYYDDQYFPNKESVADGFRRMAEEQLKQEMAVFYIADALGLRMKEREENKVFEEEIAALIEYYNAMYESQLNGGSFTKDDLADQGITKQSILYNYYYEKVSLALYDTVKDTVTYELPSEDAE